MVRDRRTWPDAIGCSPHTRGDGPIHRNTIWRVPQFSPHAWGWSVVHARGFGCAAVLPTRVGMVRRANDVSSKARRSPHTRGDGPFYRILSEDPDEVLPTRVGMVRVQAADGSGYGRSPHTRGDGPEFSEPCRTARLFSPHAWGWSVENEYHRARDEVLPTRVGMVRSCRLRFLAVVQFSPHAWGWSVQHISKPDAADVLPTRVGMVRSAGRVPRSRKRSPHTRGDGPSRTLAAPISPTFSPHPWGWSEVLGLDRVEPVVLPTRVGMVRKSASRS